MSAGLDDATIEHMVESSLDVLAPKFRDALTAALKECNDAGLDAYAYETHRSDELQNIYWQRGRTVIPPNYTVTNVKSAQYGWHFFGLAADIISRSKRWDVSDDWRQKVCAIMRSHGLACGADWPHPDLPHVQWGKCKRSPSNEARSLFLYGGIQAVWGAVGASANG
jgi:peptidoglycan L-alanyl-D-glutamate endopeptidase CwlK